MTIANLTNRFAKAAMPSFIWQYLSAWRRSSQFYHFYFDRQVRAIFPTLLATGETGNFTYDLTERNLRYMAETVACVTQRPPEEITGYIDEALNDETLKAHVATATLSPRLALRSPFGRRLGWYAIARAIKPKVIIETGVERGHGSLILCAALLRNAAEGKPGQYYGTDIDPKAGRLLVGKYAEMGRILYGDSIASLKTLSQPIDLFINDSDHSADYEYREYLTIRDKLSPKAIILADNAHVTDRLAVFSRETNRHFLFFREEPEGHWYPGAGIGISFP